MAIVITDDKNYKNIADKIREKTETEKTFKSNEMADEIGKMYDDGYQKGYNTGAEETRLINPEWTDFRAFSVYNSRNTMVDDLRETDTSNGKDFGGMFYKSDELTNVPPIDTKNGENFSEMFLDCTTLKTVPELDLSNSKDCSSMFKGCSSLEKAFNINAPNCTNFSDMFSGCSALTDIGDIDITSSENIDNIFSGCTSLANVNFISPIKHSLDLSGSSSLSKDSIKSAITNLSDEQTGTLNVSLSNVNNVFNMKENLVYQATKRYIISNQNCISRTLTMPEEMQANTAYGLRFKYTILRKTDGGPELTFSIGYGKNHYLFGWFKVMAPYPTQEVDSTGEIIMTFTTSSTLQSGYYFTFSPIETDEPIQVADIFIDDIALYKGEFTKDTVPEYVPYGFNEWTNLVAQKPDWTILAV